MRNLVPGLLLSVAFVGCGEVVDDSASDEAIDPVVDSLNQFWDVHSEELGFDYRPIGDEQITDGSDGVTCDNEPIPEQEVEDNAFVTECAEGIVVAYDPDYVGASQARAEATMSHEWGHVLQFQAKAIDLSLFEGGLPVDSEFQADCFSGAWAADQPDIDLDAIRDDVAESGDPEGVELDDPEAHGTPEERLAAFDLGYDQGARSCIEELGDLLTSL